MYLLHGGEKSFLDYLGINTFVGAHLKLYVTYYTLVDEKSVTPPQVFFPSQMHTHTAS